MGERGCAVPKSQPPPAKEMTGWGVSQPPSPRMDFTTSEVFWEG